MKTTSVINLKGGVGKSITAINLAHILAVRHTARVLLIDNDKQANTSRFFGVHDREGAGISEILALLETNAGNLIQKTRYSGLESGGTLDIIPANMSLAGANMSLYTDTQNPQLTRLRDALKPIENDYDYCIIDNAPDINLGVWNALVASDDFIIPVKIDNAAFDGIADLLEQVKDMRSITQDMHRVKLAGLLVTMAKKSNVTKQGRECLEGMGYPVFHTEIRDTVKVAETTYCKKPLLEYSRWCSAAQDYVQFAEEYLGQRKM